MFITTESGRRGNKNIKNNTSSSLLAYTWLYFRFIEFYPNMSVQVTARAAAFL